MGRTYAADSEEEGEWDGFVGVVCGTMSVGFVWRSVPDVVVAGPGDRGNSPGSIAQFQATIITRES